MNSKTKGQRNAYYRAYYAAHKEKARAANAAYRAAHRDELMKYHAVYGRAYYAANKEKIKAKGAARYAARREEIMAKHAAYYAAHKEEARARHIANYAIRGEDIKAKNAAWRVANPELMRAIVHRRRARQRAAPGYDYTTGQHIRWRMEMWGGRCYICGAENGDTVDHVIPLSRGGSHWPSNLRPCCKACNSSKNAKPLAHIIRVRKRGMRNVA